MPSDDALFFIDAVKYLDLYEVMKGRAVLDALAEQADHIFVTQQVVDEVARRKIGIVIDFLVKQCGELKLSSHSIPDHLLGNTANQREDIIAKMGEISDRLKLVNKDITAFAKSIVDNVSDSKDEVSTTLAPSFKRAVTHNEIELQRARERKERGNPPGKFTDPLGDQVSWEQIISHFKGKKKLWIVTRDGDYRTIHQGKPCLNRFLHEELLNISSAVEVFMFDDIPSAIKHYVGVTGVPAEKVLTDEQIEEFKKDETIHRPLDGLTDNDVATIVAVNAAVMRQNNAIAAIMSSGNVRTGILDYDQGGGGFVGTSGATPTEPP